MRITILLLIHWLCSWYSLFAIVPFYNQPVQPKPFVKNQGQVRDQLGNTNHSVRYLYSEGLFNLALKSDGFSYEIFEVSGNESSLNESDITINHHTESQNTAIFRSHRVDVFFEHMNPHAEIIPLRKIDAFLNFYYSPVSYNHYNAVEGYEAMLYKNLYEGIDLVFYAPNPDEETGLRYEFIIHPYADAGKISFRYEGETSLELDASGNCRIINTLGMVSESKPICYQQGRKDAVKSNYIIRKNSKRFDIATYDKYNFLIIDPNITWGTYYGGEKSDEVAEVATDSKKNVIVTGNTISSMNIATSGAYQSQFAEGVYDYFVAKFKKSGKLIWATYFGGKGKDYSYGITTDTFDNILVFGNSTSQGLATAGAFQDSVEGEADMLIAKFSNEGALLWCTYMGGQNPDQLRTGVCDQDGYIYVGGTSSSTKGISSLGAYQHKLAGKDDAVLAKFSPSGSRIWSTYLGGSDLDRAHAVSLDGSGNVYLAGTAESLHNISTPASHQPLYGGGETDAFLAKFDTAGELIWSTYYGGSWTDRARGVECDVGGNVYLAGFTESDSSISTPGAFQEKWAKGFDALNDRAEDGFIVKFTPAGIRQWGTYYGGKDVEELWGMTMDHVNGFIYIVGSTQSATGIAYGNVMQSKKNGGQDGFIGKFHLDGFIEWGSYWGSVTQDQFEDVSIDKTGNIYVAGRATSNTLAVTQGTFQQNYYGGVSDVILYKFYSGSDCYDAFEPNEVMASALLLKASLDTDSTIYGYNGSIHDPSDEDWFKIKIKPDEPNIKIVLNDLPDNYDLRLFNKLGVQIYESKNTGSVGDTIIANNLGAGNHFIQVDHSDEDFDSLACYHLIIRKSASLFEEKKSSITKTSLFSGQITIYPNPTSEELSCAFFAGTALTRMMIYDMLNREVYGQEEWLYDGIQNIKVSVSQLLPGPYQLIITQNDRVWSDEFVKQ